MPKWFAAADAEILAGMRFFATRQLRVPLQVLLRDAEMHTDLTRRPPLIAKLPWQGMWTPVTKSWKDRTGRELPMFEPLTCASDIGYVRLKGDYLPFLIAVRTIFESGLPLEVCRRRIVIEVQSPRWLEFVQRHGGTDAVAAKALARRAPHRKPRPKQAATRVDD